MKHNIQIYEPSSKNKSFGKVFRDMFSDLKQSGDLAWQLFIRDRKAEYTQSLLGILWAFFTPLATTLVWIFLSSSGAVKITDTHIPYPVFVFLGTMLWAVFTESLMTPLNQTQAAKSILSKVNFPKEAILIAGFYKNVFNLLIKLLLIALVLVVFKIKVDSGVFLFPLSIILLMFFGYAIGLIITPMGMLYKDISRGMPLLLSFLMYLSPVVYKGGVTGFMAKIIDYNPLTPLINTNRNMLTAMPVDNPTYLILILIASIFLFIIGWMFYRVSIPIIVERM